MARALKLKVFRTAIGFHDAYIAAPSQKAALAAWGTTSNLFTHGEAEIVTDAELSEEPLARPGTDIKRLRATTAQHLAALPRDRAAKQPARSAPAALTPKTPRPRRDEVDRLEVEIAELTVRQTREAKALEAEAKAIERRRKELESEQQSERQRLDRELTRARARYEEALKAWK